MPIHSSCCKKSHDLAKYLASKPADILKECPAYTAFGRCPQGVKCRAGSCHTLPDGKQLVNEELASKDIVTQTNFLSNDIRKALRAKKYDFSRSDEQRKLLDAKKNNYGGDDSGLNEMSAENKRFDPETRPVKKKPIDFIGKTYLAPLTTVGNMPFRRICKEYGVDITCSEMAMAGNILKGTNGEWALLRRHVSEDIFGVQICGNNFEQLVNTSELINNECNVDFIDLNVGCPIDSVYEKGCGSGMFKTPNKMYGIINAMNNVTDFPMTVKYRTGISIKQPIAIKVTQKLDEMGIQLGIVHGRSRQQRYSKLADWDYIKQVKESSKHMQIFGNGDVFSWEDYWEKMEETKVDGIMIGRGALIKPWIFEEIKERKVWDITSNERLELLKKFCNYGLEHWGSDDIGVNHTRRYLLEWQSFLCRYVPVGLLEVLPAKMNQRPPAYYGRNELETLMASTNVADWIKISEMMLGPTPDDFVFIPKHKSNSYEG
ncbi:tRNA-dihydrouridine(47) synthase [NAD(P)(+)]-like [Smittium mucronatum]|uniref:tRNA-dihydrouridine(47) synthase [NAD(P)(+)] n=1 Tax=Smittium mucronatum TaxID=133383 RepID=A0A1R0GM70_9FUNG|nr:tRNA-dihydrouridine(47) synthase [NAD(P)(+)]-like [Smittium mucronatum]